MILNGHAFTPNGGIEVARATCARCQRLAGWLYVPGTDWSSANVAEVGWRGPGGRGKVCQCPLIGPEPATLVFVARRAVRERRPVRVVLDADQVREATADELAREQAAIESTQRNLDRNQSGTRASERHGIASAAALLRDIINRPEN